MKRMVLAANGMNGMVYENEMQTWIRERDYQAISDRLSDMEPASASRWLALQDEELRFSVACLMQPEKAKPLPIHSPTSKPASARWQNTESSG